MSYSSILLKYSKKIKDEGLLNYYLNIYLTHTAMKSK